MTQGILFSDVDGTLVHYPDTFDALGTLGSFSSDNRGRIFTTVEGEEQTVLQLHPSSTGLQGAISLRTLRLCKQVRRMGIKLVVISGARTSTMMQRLPFLPYADAIVTENGGRIFLRDEESLTAASLVEDLSWREKLSCVTGPVSQEGTSPDRRQGLLWDMYRYFKQRGWELDANSYSTSFRVKAAALESSSRLADELAALPPELACSFNLGMADVYPATSGKEMAAKWLMDKWGAAPGSCSLLCDDDNDIGIAGAVGRVFMPSVSADSIRKVAEADPAKFYVARARGFAATEEAIEEFLRNARRPRCAVQ
uniref:Sucrose phosphatase-like domain-containing protein n=1 Tax=Tetraselmis sp. GSL018 TaxID=582737 RepID=A0A061SLR9_9CHLO